MILTTQLHLVPRVTCGATTVLHLRFYDLEREKFNFFFFVLVSTVGTKSETFRILCQYAKRSVSAVIFNNFGMGLEQPTKTLY